MRKLRSGFDAQDGMSFPIGAWGGKPPISNVQEMGGSSSRAGAFCLERRQHPGIRAIRKARPIPSGNSGSQLPQIQGDSPPPLSHAFKYAIQKHKTADRMLFFKKYTSRNLPRLHIQPPFTVADYRPPIQTRNMSPKAGHLPAWLDFGQLLVS